MLYLLKTLLYIDVLVAAGLLLFRWSLTRQHRALVSGKLAAIVLITPIVALFSGSVYYLLLYLALVVAFNSRSRLELAGVFLFLLPSTPLLAVETGVAGTYLFAFSTMTALGLGALVGTVVTRARGPRIPIRYNAAVWFLVVLFVFIDNRFASVTVVLRSLAPQTLLLVAPYLLVSRAARNSADVEQLLLRWTLGATILAVTACYQAWQHWVLFEVYYGALHVHLPALSAAASLRGGFLRSGGSMIDYSAGGLFLAAVITALPLLRLAFRPIGFAMVAGVLGLGLIATQSRGAWLATIVGFVVVAFWRAQWTRVFVVGGLGVLGGLLIPTLGRSGRLAEILGQSGHAASTATYRSDLLSEGLAQVRSYPALGQRSDQLVKKLLNLTQGDHIVDFVNSHLYIAMTAGVPLFLVWCAVWIMPMAESLRLRRGGSSIAAVPLAVLAPTMVALTFTSIIDRNLTWPIVALALSPACFVFAERSRSASTRVTGLRASFPLRTLTARPAAAASYPSALPAALSPGAFESEELK